MSYIGVSKIKKTIWIVVGILLIALLVFSATTFKKQYTMKQIKEIPKQEQTIEKDKQETPTEETEDVDKDEDPVKYFLSEKVERAMKLFFGKQINIVAIGDSLTEGVGDETENEGYVGILRDTINLDEQLANITNLGKRGNRTDQLLKRLNEEPEVIQEIKDADIILMTIGANDIMQIFKENFTDLTLRKFAVEQTGYKTRLNGIFMRMQELNPKAEIYMIGFYNPFKKFFTDIEELEIIVDNWNQIGEDVVLNHKRAYYIPTKDLFENTSINYLSGDNFHPNHLGYELMAERILQSITNEGKEVDTDG
jgi:lysophospholipase L1-like esterase